MPGRRPRQWKIVAVRSCGCTRPSRGWPPCVGGAVDLAAATPPPARATEKTWPQWSRPPARVDLRRPAELAHPDHQRLVQQAALVQVFQQGRDRPGPSSASGPSCSRGRSWRACPSAGLSVGSSGPRPVDLHQRHAGLDQPPGQQHALAPAVAAVAVAHGRRLLVEVERRPRRPAAEQVERLPAGASKRSTAGPCGTASRPRLTCSSSDAGGRRARSAARRPAA